MDDEGPFRQTGRMNASRSPTVALASTELTAPAKSTQKPTAAIAAPASHAEREASVPRHTNTAPTPANDACASRRSLIGPPKSTRTSEANEPNAANTATIGFEITLSAKANRSGIRISARPARRSAASPGSCARYHAANRSTLARNAVSG